MIGSALAGGASGAALWLAFPPVDLGPVAFVALVPLVFVFRTQPARRVALAGAVFALTFFGLLVSWTRLFGPEAYLALVGLQTAWMVLTLYVGRLWLRRVATGGVTVFPVVFLAGEYLRSNFPLGGFPWGGLGYSQHDFLLLLQLSSVAGVWGVSFMVALFNSFVTEAVIRRGSLRSYAGWLTGGAATVLLVPALVPIAQPSGDRVRIAIVQGNAPEGTEDPTIDDEEVFLNHVQLTRTLPADLDLVVWPESALGEDPRGHPVFGRQLEALIEEANRPFLVGANVPVGVDRFRNSNIFYDAEGRPIDFYDKRHLVPFGEYFPWRARLEPILGGFIEQLELLPRDGIPGTEATVFPVGGGDFGSVICYESAYPGLVRSLIRNGAGVLVVSTNNSSFERSALSEQHVALSQLRAAENRMWLAHAALTGISAVVAPSGEVLSTAGLFEGATLIADTRLQEGLTLYARLGDWAPVLALVWMVTALVSAAASRRREAWVAPLEEAVERALVIIPTFNEAESISLVLDGVLDAVPDAEVLVVDDSSPDGTGRLVEERSDPRVHLLTRPVKEGLGGAYREGFRWGLERGFNRFVEMDADLSHDPMAVPRLLAAAGVAPVVVGSRYVQGGGIEGWSLLRHVLSRSGNAYARLALGVPVRDSTSGFRCLRREVLETIEASKTSSQGYVFQIDLIRRALRAGFPVVEVPILFSERRAGKSKISRRIILEALGNVAVWGIGDLVTGRRHLPSGLSHYISAI